MKFSPIEASETITKKYKRYLKTAFEIADPDYAGQFDKELNAQDIFAKGPYLDVLDSFKKGKSLSELMDEGIISKAFGKAGFPMERTLYLHQEEAIRKSAEGNNIVVSTGTGSGKTESFLIPILAELAKEDEAGTLCPGVRALIIYPMNALANDQMERLREILSEYPQITFGSYTGQTKQDRTKALQEYRVLNNGREPKGNELICRDDMIKNPPHILITNYAMLEYLMIRPTENTFFNGLYAKYWKYIVLDEAHVYSGSTGIEVSMLLRRLKSSLPVKNIQYILTSATLGSEDQNAEVAEFATRLCNSLFTEKNVIRAIRQRPKQEDLDTFTREFAEYQNLARAINNEDECRIQDEVKKLVKIESNEDIHAQVYDLVLADQNYWNIRKLLQEKPQTVYFLANAMGCSAEEIEDFVTVAAFAIKNSTQLLDAKYHMFIKACDSAFVTLGKSKKLMLNRNKQIYDNGLEYAVFEIAVCTFCHKIYLIGRISPEGYFQQKSMNDSFDEKEILYLGDTISDEDEEHSLKNENMKVEEYKLCSRCGKLMIPNASGTECCEHREEEYVTVYRVIKSKQELTKCVACENTNNKGVLRQFFAGQEAVTSVIGTALFEALPSYKIVREKVEFQDDFLFDDEEESSFEKTYTEESAKQFIAFSDSRQAAAFYASYLEKTYTTILYKRLIVEAIKSRSFQGNVEQFVSVLEAEFEKKNVLKDEGLSAEKEAWKAVLNEMVDSFSGNALQNLGFYELTVDRDSVPGMSKAGLSSEDVANIINLCLQTMMLEAAIAYPVPLNQTDKEFFTYNGHEGGFTLSDGGKKIACKSFIPTKANGLNKRVDFVEKIIENTLPGQDRNYAIRLLESIWKLLIKKELIVNEGIEYKVNSKKIQINSNARFYQCPLCKKITSYNVKGVCPTYKCKGILQEIDLHKTLEENHYYRMYQDLEIRGLRVVEHTAQLNKEKAYTYQNLFKEKKVDVLSCSTTFEMGVDVGSLETVFMRNMPPSPANYAQRAGRAGRSSKSVAFALTFCNKGNHDFMYFNNPESMIRGSIKPPIFKVENEKIVIRHVFASAFGFFWRKHPEYFADVETLIEPKNGQSGIDILLQYLGGKPDNLKEYLIDFLPKQLHGRFDIENFGWIMKLLSDKGVLTRASKEYFYEIGILEKSLQEALTNNGRVDYLRWRINNYKKESVISFLSKKSVLPKYGFPVDTVELSIWDSKTKNKLELDLQRDLAMAISEYAPGSQIVADGNLITSQYIKKMPNMDWRMFDYAYCECNTLNIEPHIEYEDEEHLKTCKVCGKELDKSKVYTFIVPEFGFEAGMVTKAGLIKPKRTYNGEVAYVGYRNEVKYNVFQLKNRKYEIAFSPNDEMAVLNRSNFYVCNTCGYTHLAMTGFQSVYQKAHRKSNGAKCENENLKRYSLGYRFDTDVVQIRFCWPQLKTYEQALSVLYGIMKGTCSYLNIEENDIAGCLQYFYNRDTKSGSFTIILYDKTPGGAGHVKRLNDPTVFEAVLNETKRIIEKCSCGNEQKDTSCYNCLRSYSNQRVHDILQRRYVLEFLEDFFDENLNSVDTFVDYSIGKKDAEENENSSCFAEQFELLLKNSESVLNEKQRFIGLLKDYLYGYPKQLNLVISLYQMNIQKDILQTDYINDIFAYRFEKRLVNDIGISSENAKWAVSAWCTIYGKQVLNKPCDIEFIEMQA